jgi:large subunit ribosomal protein L4
MLAVRIVNMLGQPAGEVQVDPAVLGGRVRPKLIKQAVVMYLDRQRQRSARTKRRSDVAGSTRKLYRQKGTGNARAGMIRTPVRRGGGRTFGKRVPGAVKEMPQKMRRLACQSAILAKIQADDAVIVSDFALPQIKTKTMANMLSAIGASSGCVLAIDQLNDVVHRSGRNIPKTEVRVVEDLTAYEVLRRRKLVFTRPAFDRLVARASDPVSGAAAD